MEQPLAEEEKRFLLSLARQTLEAHFDARPLPSAGPEPGALTEPRGAFVTLTRAGELRGCIGHVIGVAPLWRSVRENTLNAALRDPRFPPVEAPELPALQIEISALTPLREVAAPEDVVVGRHGVMIENGPFRGLLLPQVATEYGWDRETFLDHTCRKAGLQTGCWRRPETRIHVFLAEVFSE